METQTQNNSKNIPRCNGQYVCQFCGKKYDIKQSISKHRLNSYKLNPESNFSKKNADSAKIKKFDKIVTKDANLLENTIAKPKIVMKMNNKGPLKITNNCRSI